MINFRRHANTEIVFDVDRSFNVIVGANGAGKSSIIEAVLFALYSEPRSQRPGHRKSSLNELVRRGCELEGMEVELGITLDNTAYRIIRKREGNAAFAQLWANGVLIVEGANQVTAEVSRIFGLDSSGFRLSVVAEQKEVDGLASLRPAERAKFIDRLLRLDRLVTAKTTARELLRRDRDKLIELEKAINTQDLATELAEILSKREQIALTINDRDLEIKYLTDQINELTPKVEVTKRVIERRKNVEQNLANVVQKIEAIEKRLEKLVPTELVEPDKNLDSLEKDLEACFSEKASVKEAIASKEQKEAMLAHRAKLEDELLELSDLKDTLLVKVSEMPRVLQLLEDQTNLLNELNATKESAQRTVTICDNEIAAVESKLDNLSKLEAVCLSCGQPVDPEYVDKHVKEVKEELSIKILDRDTAYKALQDTKDEIIKVTKSRKETEAELYVIKSAEKELTTVDKKSKETLSTLELYREIGSPTKTATKEDLVALERKEAELRSEIKMVKEYAEALAKNKEMEVRRSELLSTRIDEEIARDALTAELVEIDSKDIFTTALVEQEKLRAELAAANDLLRKLQIEDATLAGVYKTKTTQLEDLKKMEVRAAKLLESVKLYSSVAKVMEAASKILATELRPNLESISSQVLSILSDNRYNLVQISEEYGVLVYDDDKYRDISEFSGGEIDLIALSIRLALAEAVSHRYGKAGVGFLILDECLGSQDYMRQESVKRGLKKLSSRYGQIFVVSHVQGLEEDADSVIAVDIDIDDFGNKAATVLVK